MKTGPIIVHPRINKLFSIQHSQFNILLLAAIMFCHLPDMFHR